MDAYRWASASFAFSIARPSHHVFAFLVGDSDVKERRSAAWEMTSGEDSVPRSFKSLARHRNVALIDRISGWPGAFMVGWEMKLQNAKSIAWNNNKEICHSSLL